MRAQLGAIPAQFLRNSAQFLRNSLTTPATATGKRVRVVPEYKRTFGGGDQDGDAPARAAVERTFASVFYNNERNAARTLRWLPERIPDNCSLILTTTNADLRVFRLRGWNELVTMPPLQDTYKGVFTRQFFTSE